MSTPQFQINSIYQEEAARIVSARRSGKIIHTAGDIAASGDEVEIAVRDFLRRRLPPKFHVGHGKIVDKNLAVSPQLDVIISDGNACPVLFEGEGGAQFFPYESVYAFGEVKTSYDSSKRPIHALADTYAKIKSDLVREKTPCNYVGGGISLGPGFEIPENVPYRNPLFAFALFMEKGDLAHNALASEYSSHPTEHLPNVVAFLDGTVLHKLEITVQGEELTTGDLVFGTHAIQAETKFFWLRRDFENPVSRGGLALAILMLGLFDQLNSCILMPPEMDEYMVHILKGEQFTSQLLDLKEGIKLAEMLGKDVPDEIRAVFKDMSPEALRALIASPPKKEQP